MSLRNDLETLKKKFKKKEKKPSSFFSVRGTSDYGAGIDIVAGIITAFAVVWGFGHILTISYFWRIIIGMGVAIAVNGLMLYRMRDK